MRKKYFYVYIMFMGFEPRTLVFKSLRRAMTYGGYEESDWRKLANRHWQRKFSVPPDPEDGVSSECQPSIVKRKVIGYRRE